MECRLCRYEVEPSPEGRATSVCVDCRDKLGIVPLPPPRRPARPCAHCNGLRFVRAIPREHAAVQGHRTTEGVAAPMTVATAPAVRERLLSSKRSVELAGLREGAGVLETYVCTACGYVEWFCQDPAAIPIGPEFMTDVVDYTPDAPFR